MRRFLVAGNWKMNTNLSSGTALAASIAEKFPEEQSDVEILICPPALYLSAVKSAIEGSGVGLGAQDCHFESSGAFTGEISAEMVRDLGCRSVILGHSERRHVFGEQNDSINKKTIAALGQGLQAILCVGELLEERESNSTEAVLDQQMKEGLAGIDAADLANLVIAYEPVWAIGTGLTASPEQADQAHAHLRNWLKTAYNDDVAEKTRILYGGSVKPDNAQELLQQPNVDGALVGGASLKSELFLPIIFSAVEVATG